MAAPITPLASALRRSTMFSECDDDTLMRLAQAASHRRFRRGDVLFREGDPAVFLATIGSGIVKLVRRSPLDSTLALFGPRETIGNLAVAARGRYPGDAVAMTDEVGVLCVGADVLHDLMTRSSCVARAMSRSLVEHGQALHAKTEIMSAGSVERRLAMLFLYLMRRFGDQDADGTHFVPVALSRGDLASLVGATIETTIRTMRRWHTGAIVETTKGGFRIPSLARMLDTVGLPVTWACSAA